MFGGLIFSDQFHVLAVQIKRRYSIIVWSPASATRHAPDSTTPWRPANGNPPQECDPLPVRSPGHLSEFLREYTLRKGDARETLFRHVVDEQPLLLRLGELRTDTGHTAPVGGE